MVKDPPWLIWALVGGALLGVVTGVFITQVFDRMLVGWAQFTGFVGGAATFIVVSALALGLSDAVPSAIALGRQPGFKPGDEVEFAASTSVHGIERGERGTVVDLVVPSKRNRDWKLVVHWEDAGTVRMLPRDVRFAGRSDRHPGE